MTRTLSMVLLACGLAVAQPERGSAPVRGSQPERGTPQDRPGERLSDRMEPEKIREELAARLERSLAFSKELEKAMAAIDAGESPMAAIGLLRGEGGRPPLERGGEEGRGLDRQGWSGRLTEDELVEAEAFVREHVPRIAERLDKAREADAESAKRMMFYLGPRIRDVMRSRDRGEALFAARIEELGAMADVLDAMRAFRDENRAEGRTPERLEAARGQLRDVLLRQFDLNIEVQRIEIADLERQLDERRAEIARKLENRSRMVDEMLRRSTSEPGRDRRRGDGEGKEPSRSPGGAPPPR